MLRQEINLYQAARFNQAEELFLNWRRLRIFYVIFTCLMIILYLYTQWNVHSLSLQRDQLHEENTALETQFNKKKESYPPIFFSQDISLGLDQLKLNLAEQNKMLKSLANPMPYSKTLIALSESITPNVWLTEMNMNKGANEFTLKGKSISMEDLQLFLAKLSKHPVFANYTLTVNNIEKAEKIADSQAMSFELAIQKKSS